jgi:hypothetical protein
MLQQFWTMIVGGIDIRFVKGEDFENQIIWGVREHSKLPTLIHPRPKININ